MADPKKLHLRITAGSSYDTANHQLVPVNTSTPIELHSDLLDAQVYVKIQNYRGLPSKSPTTSPYFSEAPHTSDLYSISFSFTPKKSIPGTDLVFGNDFEHAIRDRLPPGFSAALRIVKWSIDPGLDGDVYAEKPYLYGPLASSINALWVGDKVEGDAKALEDAPIHEGGSGSGLKTREDKKVPTSGPQRMKHFLTESHRKDWTFEQGREYRCDFFNPYLDFNELALKLPGNFKLHLMSFWDGQPLRYVLKHRTQDGKTDEAMIVIVISLIPEEEVKDREGQLEKEKKTSATESLAPAHKDKDFTGVAGGAGGGSSGGGTEGSSNYDDGGVD